MGRKENQRWNTVIMKFRQEVRYLRFWGINGCRITEERLNYLHFHNHLEVDPYAAEVVGRIYKMYRNGFGCSVICRVFK